MRDIYETYFKNLDRKIIVCYIIALAFFAITLTASILIYPNLTEETAYTATILFYLPVSALFAMAVIIILLNIKSSRISAVSQLRAEKSLGFYLSRTAFIIFLIFVGFNYAVTQLSFIFNALLYWLRDMLSWSTFLSGLVVKLPMFVLILLAQVWIFHRDGYSDEHERDFNPHLAVLIVILGMTFMMPVTIRDHMYKASMDTEGLLLNPQTVFSNNADIPPQLVRARGDIVNNFSYIWVIISTVAASAVQVAVCAAAYGAGRAKFRRAHPHSFGWNQAEN